MIDMEVLKKVLFGALVAATCLMAGCSRPAADQVQGYIEGEFVYVSSPLAGTLETLSKIEGKFPHLVHDGTGQWSSRNDVLYRGVLAAIARQCPRPVRYIGVGEGIEDLQPFRVDEFVGALFETPGRQ